MALLPSDLVGCDSPLQIVMAVWRTFLKFEACQTAIVTVSSGLSHPTQEVQIKKKAPNCHYYLQRAYTPYLMGSITL
jgi:hypothetical protein